MVRVTLSPPSITPESITTMFGREAGKTKVWGSLVTKMDLKKRRGHGILRIVGTGLN